ncbi:MAG: hypothetical protein PUJ94_09710 [Ruminococcus sp.]|nr:hypothetical protein [Ruminococcus sp.]
MLLKSIHPSKYFSVVAVEGLKLFIQPFTGSFPGFSPPQPLGGIFPEKWKPQRACGIRQKLWSGKGKSLETFVESAGLCRMLSEKCQKRDWANCGAEGTDAPCAWRFPSPLF